MCMCAVRIYHNSYLDIERRPLGAVWSRNFYFRKFNKSDESGSLTLLQGRHRSGDSGVQKG